MGSSGEIWVVVEKSGLYKSLDSLFGMAGLGEVEEDGWVKDDDYEFLCVSFKNLTSSTLLDVV